MSGDDRNRGGFISSIIRYFVIEIIITAVQTIVQLFTWGTYIAIYQKLSNRIENSIICHILTAIIMILIIISISILVFYFLDISADDFYYRRRFKYY